MSMLVYEGDCSVVTLKARLNENDKVREHGDYVLFGKYNHRLWDMRTKRIGDFRGRHEPILWRVMETRVHDKSKRGIILLSHYLLDAMAYQDAFEDDDAHYRPATEIFANTWAGSKVQLWLNSTATVRVCFGADRYRGGEYWYDEMFKSVSHKGFLHEDYFSSKERALMLNYPYNRHGEGEDVGLSHQVVLPSCSSIAGACGFEVGAWFGRTKDTSVCKTRTAHFKGSPEALGVSGESGLPYWTRSPYKSHPSNVHVVLGIGKVYDDFVGYAKAGVRPACFVNLGPIIHKSDSTLFSSPLGKAGTLQNPYFLYQSTSIVLPEKLIVVKATASGRTLTLKFDTAMTCNRRIYHAYADVPSASGLADKFAVMGNKVMSALVNGDSVILTLKESILPGYNATVTYALPVDSDTDVLGFVSAAPHFIPTTVSTFSVKSLTIKS